MGTGHGTGKVGQGQAYGVWRTETRVKVRMENRKIMDIKQGSGKCKWNKGGQGLEFRYGVAWSVTYSACGACVLGDAQENLAPRKMKPVLARKVL